MNTKAWSPGGAAQGQLTPALVCNDYRRSPSEWADQDARKRRFTFGAVIHQSIGLHDQTLLASSISFLKSASTPLTGNNTGVSDFNINNADHTTLIIGLANQSAALASAGIPGDNDPKALREAVNKASLEDA